MYIKQIRLKNYRCYKKAEIKFGLEQGGKKNINLATGEIKAGKTTLFNAVGWCLYNIETQFLLGTKIKEKDEKPIPNEDSYEGNKSRVEVEIDIKIPEGSYIESLSIRRTSTFIKGATEATSTDFKIEAYHGGEPVKITDYHKFLNQFLPKDLIQFYLFDGEYLVHAAANSNLQIRDGLRKLFNIEKIENASEMIEELVGDWYKQSSKMPKKTSRMAEIDTEISTNLEKKHEEEIKVNDEEKKRVGFISDRDRLKEELDKSFELQQAINKFSEFEKQEKRIEGELKQENEEYYSDILANAYLINARTVLNQVNKLVEAEPKLKTLPANVRQIYLNYLINRGTCVCTHEIKKGSKEEKAIKDELKIAESEERLDFLLDLTYKIPNMLKLIDEKVAAINSRFKEINRLELERKSIIKNKNDVQKELPKGKIDVNLYQNNMNKFTALSDEINDAEKNLRFYRDSISDLDNKIKELKDERDDIIEKSGEISEINDNIKIGEALKRIFDRFNREILNNIASELETEINGLIEKNEKLSGLSVKITTDKNNIDFKFLEKGSTKHYLTGGQNQLYGIIIMAAFVRIMDKRGGEKLPFVFMDNPFSAIDKRSLEIASAGLSDLFKNAQVILFTTNDKFDRVYKSSKESIVNAMIFNNDGENVKIQIQGT